MGQRRKNVALAAVRTPQDAPKTVNEYYVSVAEKCSWAKYLTLIVLALYLVLMLAIYRSYITYDNLAYLLRDISSDADTINSDFADISYDEQSGMEFALFKGELAVAGSGSISLYNSSANKTFSYSSQMDSPQLIPSEKYLLAYDPGGTHYSLFTNLTRVLDDDADSVIENASIANDGSFLLVLRSRESKYVVSTYSSSFRNEVNYYKSRFVSDAALSPDGEIVAIASVDTADGVFDFSIELYKRNSETPYTEYHVTDLYPVSLKFYDDSSFAVICESKILFFDKNGALKNQYVPGSSSICLVDQSSSTLAVVLSKNSTGNDNSVIIFDNEGNISYNIDVPSRVVDLSHGPTHLYVLCPEKILRYTLTYENGQRSYTCDETESSIDTAYVLEAGNFAIAGTNTRSTCAFGKSTNQKTEETK